MEPERREAIGQSADRHDPLRPAILNHMEEIVTCRLRIHGHWDGTRQDHGQTGGDPLGAVWRIERHMVLFAKTRLKQTRGEACDGFGQFRERPSFDRVFLECHDRRTVSVRRQHANQGR
jgi:hypothetical protein